VTDDTPTIAVTFVTAPACHLCDRGRDVLADLATRYPLDIREVSLDAPEGRRALAASRAPFPPVLVIEGRPVAHGRLSARGLARELDRLRATVTGG
jgi:hypothetical protein